MSRCHVALACLLIAAAAARAEEVPPRVAIVATAPALRNVIAAAEAKVSAAGGVRLVERHQIDRVLTEQGLAASGVTGGEQAVTAGKLLAADLLVAVDNDPANGEEAAAVVFDAATGVRYWDAATASRGEGLSDDIAAAVMTAVKKRYAGAATKMVALQTVRNADLPREFDGACRAAGAILMRCLASSPDVVVLERARLNKITDERQLTGIDNPLLASTISIELQIARSATGDGVDVTPALLKPGLERTVLRAITVPSRRPDAIAQVAAASITEALNAAAPRPSGDDGRAAESRRFVRETLLAWRHGDVATALESAEAAHALDPADRRAGAARAQALIVAGAAIIYEGNVADPDQPPLDWSMRTADLKRAPQSRLSDEDVDASLALTQRGTEALLALGCRPGGADDLRTAAVRMRGYLIDEEPLIRAAEITLRRYLGGIRWEIYERDRGKLDIRRLRLTKTQAAAYATIRRDFRHLRMSVEQPVARSMVRSPQTFDTYGRFLTDLMYDARCIWPSDGQEWTTDWATLVTDWIMMAEEHARFAPERDPWAPETITRPSPRAMARTATRPTTRAVMQGTAHPTTRRTLRAMTRPVTNPAEFDPSYFNGLPLGMWEMTGDGVIHDWGGGYYDLNWKMTPADWDRLRGAFDALETLPYGPASRVASAMRIRAQHEGSLVYAVKVPSNRPPDAPPPTPRMLREPREAKAPTVEAASFVGSGTAWPSSSELLKLDGRDAVALPRIDDDGKNAYAVVLRSSSRLELTRFDVATGAGNVVSTYRADSAVDLPSLGTAALNNFSAALSGGFYVLSDPSTGVYLFPLAGGPARRVDRASANLPTDGYHAAALLGDALYLAVGQRGKEGLLVAYSLKDGAMRTLASGRKLSAGEAATTTATSSPFDSAAPMIVWHMHSDVPRKRIVFLAMSPGWERGMNGWWSYEPAGNRFRQLLPVEIPDTIATSRDGVWVQVLKGDRLAYGLRFGFQPASILDLASDKATPLPRVPTASGYEGPGSESNRGGPALAPPLAEANRWVWGKFGRYRIVDTDVNGRRVQKPELQSFDPLRPVAIQWGDWPSYVEPIDGDRVVVCDPSGLWLLRLPSDDPTVMAKLVARPRPVFAPVEPMGPPPVGGDLPWRAVRTIYDSLRNVNVGDGKAAIMFGPRVVADDVYVLACGDGTTTPGATRLIKYALADGRRTELGSAFVEGNIAGSIRLNRAEQATGDHSANKVAIDDVYYYFASGRQTVYAFPLAGGEPKLLTFRQGRYTSVSGLAAVGGKLFVSLVVRDGTPADEAANTHKTTTKLIRHDMSSGARDDLPLATVTAGGQEPLSSSPALALGLLTADPKRGRVLFFLNRQPTSEAAIDGLWSCAAGGAPERLAPPSAWAVTGQRFGASPFDWADAVRGDNWLVTSLNGAIRIDLAKLSAERLWQVEPAGGTPLNASYDFRPPMAVVGEWLYDGQFRRAKLKGAAYEQLPALRPMEMKGYRFQLKLVEKTDRAHLIAADNCGLWVLELVDREGR